MAFVKDDYCFQYYGSISFLIFTFLLATPTPLVFMNRSPYNRIVWSSYALLIMGNLFRKTALCSFLDCFLRD